MSRWSHSLAVEDWDSPFGHFHSSRVSSVSFGTLSPSDRKWSSSSPASTLGDGNAAELWQDEYHVADLTQLDMRVLLFWQPLSAWTAQSWGVFGTSHFPISWLFRFYCRLGILQKTSWRTSIRRVLHSSQASSQKSWWNFFLSLRPGLGTITNWRGVFSPSLMLPLCITNLRGMKTFDTVTRSDVMFTSMEIREVELAACALFEAASWVDWWLHATWAMNLAHIFFAPTQC